MLVVLAIIGTLAGVVSLSFSKFGQQQSLDKDTLTALAVLNEAQSAAESSKNFSSWGVRIGTSTLTLFQGSYGTGNVLYSFSSYSAMSTSSGIGTDIIFSNVSGSTAASGTITVYTINNPSKTATIRVFSTGQVEKD